MKSRRIIQRPKNPDVELGAIELTIYSGEDEGHVLLSARAGFHLCAAVLTALAALPEAEGGQC